MTKPGAVVDMLELLFGTGSELDWWQMSARAVVVCAAALAMIRVSGRRSFGQGTAFDACTTVLLGAVLSRAVAGASPFVPTLSAGLVIVVLHRLVAWISVRSERFERIVSGTERILVTQGARDRSAMQKALISDRDLAEAARKHFGADSQDEIGRAVLERDGAVSLGKK